MSPHPEDIGGSVAAHASRRGATTLLVVLALLALGIAMALAYNGVRLAEKHERDAVALAQGDPQKGFALIRQYGCAGCHRIPGVDGAGGSVGPDLNGLSRRVYIAGVVPNTPDNAISFIVDPQGTDSKSAMPRTGITEGEARDVLAYLYSQL